MMRLIGVAVAAAQLRIDIDRQLTLHKQSNATDLKSHLKAIAELDLDDRFAKMGQDFGSKLT